MQYIQARTYARENRTKQTPAEKFVWEQLRRSAFMGLKFNRQFPIEHSEVMGIKSFFIPDFHCYEKKLLVEIDGKIHEQQKAYDQEREQILEGMGYTIVRFTNEEVLTDWKSVKEKLKVIIDEIDANAQN